MVFSSVFFLLCFLPLVLTVYYLIDKKFKNVVLLIFSLVFYAWGEPVYIWLMLFSVVFNYICGLFVKGKKSVLVLSVTGNLATLLFFKYADFLIGTVNTVFSAKIPFLNLALPIGISFYTFQAMSYVIDVYRGDAVPQKNIVSFGTYISLFPQLIAGPIVRYTTIEKQLSDRRVTSESLFNGIVVFIIGLGKKVLIANNIGMLWENMHSAGSIPVVSAWLGIIAFTLQIYFDFSGYSDMAVGLGKMFGFDFERNFNYPYISTSVTDFWRRWHISLSTWFKEYVYIPLGGNRVSKGRKTLNLFIVWALTGLWHGASFNFILWGLYYAVLLVLEKDYYGKYIEKCHKGIQIAYSLFTVIIGWVFFACTSMADIMRYLGNMFGVGAKGFFNMSTWYALSSNFVMLLIGVIAMIPLGKKVLKPVFEKRPLLAIIPCGVIFILCMIYLADATYNPFLYFRF